jgi:hypothetical protein
MNVRNVMAQAPRYHFGASECRVAAVGNGRLSFGDNLDRGAKWGRSRHWGDEDVPVAWRGRFDDGRKSVAAKAAEIAERLTSDVAGVVYVVHQADAALGIALDAHCLVTADIVSGMNVWHAAWFEGWLPKQSAGCWWQRFDSRVG